MRSARLLPRRSTFGGLVLALAAWVPLASAQAVRFDATAVVPFPPCESPGRQCPDRAPGPSPVSLYATAFLGAAGSVDGVAPPLRGGFHYASVHLLFSAAALPVPRQSDRSVVGDLQRLHAQVRLTPLDSAQRPIADASALQLLATVPDSAIAATRPAAGDSGSTHAATAALSVVTRALLPELQAGIGVAKRVGPAVASFTRLYDRPTARLQIAYVSDPRVFGWLWHAHETDVIEGTHRTSAVIEINSAVRYVRVQVHMVGEWRSRGAWQRDLEIVLSMSAEP